MQEASNQSQISNKCMPDKKDKEKLIQKYSTSSQSHSMYQSHSELVISDTKSSASKKLASHIKQKQLDSLMYSFVTFEGNQD